MDNRKTPNGARIIDLERYRDVPLRWYKLRNGITKVFIIVSVTLYTLTILEAYPLWGKFHEPAESIIIIKSFLISVAISTLIFLLKKYYKKKDERSQVNLISKDYKNIYIGSPSYIYNSKYNEGNGPILYKTLGVFIYLFSFLWPVGFGNKFYVFFVVSLIHGLLALVRKLLIKIAERSEIKYSDKLLSGHYYYLSPEGDPLLSEKQRDEYNKVYEVIERSDKQSLVRSFFLDGVYNNQEHRNKCRLLIKHIPSDTDFILVYNVSADGDNWLLSGTEGVIKTRRGEYIRKR